MGLLVECPKCKTRNSPKSEKCNCGLPLKKLGNKSYRIEYYDDTGKRRRERIGPSKGAAEQRLREVLKARTEERHIQKDRATRISLKDLAHWYKQLPEVISKRSFSRDEKSIKNLLQRLNGDIRVKDITAGKS